MITKGAKYRNEKHQTHYYGLNPDGQTNTVKTLRDTTVVISEHNNWLYVTTHTDDIWTESMKENRQSITNNKYL